MLDIVHHHLVLDYELWGHLLQLDVVCNTEGEEVHELGLCLSQVQCIVGFRDV